MNAARFSMQFEINYQQNRGKLKKKGSFQTPVYSAMHEFVFYTKAEAVSLVSLLLLYFIIILFYYYYYYHYILLLLYIIIIIF